MPRQRLKPEPFFDRKPHTENAESHGEPVNQNQEEGNHSHLMTPAIG
jgi:hypothetical protein